jgi:hypothetical protein
MPGARLARVVMVAVTVVIVFGLIVSAVAVPRAL